MVNLAASVWRDFVTDGVPSSGANKTRKSDVRQWGAYLESLANLSFTSGKVYATKAALTADLVPGANTPALVIGDTTPGNDGLYQKVGATTTGSWVQLTDFVPGAQIVHAVDAGAGTPNAIIATSSIGLSASGSQIVRLDVFEANTGPATVAFNGGTPMPIKTASGNNVASGGLTAGPVLGVVSGSNFRLLSDQASAAIVAAAEVWANAASASATDSDAAAVRSQNYAALAGAALAPLTFATVASLLADTVLSYTAGGGHVVVGTGDIIQARGFRYKVAASGASNHDLTTAGGIKLYVQEAVTGYDVRSFGAVGDGVADDTVPIQKTIDRVKTAVGGVARLPAGTYKISAKIQVYGNFDYRSIKVSGDNAQIVSTHAGPAIEFDPSDPSPAPQVKQRSDIDGVTFLGPGLGVAGSIGISIVNGATVEVHNCKVRGYEKGLSVVGGLILRFFGLELYNNAYGYYITSNVTYAPNDIHFMSCYIFENTRIGFAEKFPNGVISFNECEIEGNNYVAGNDHDGINCMEFSQAGKVNLIACHLESNKGQRHILFAGGSSSSVLNIIGGEMIPGNDNTSAIEMAATFGAYGHLQVFGGRITNAITNQIVMGTGLSACIIGETAGNISGDLSKTVIIKNGKINVGSLGVPANAAMRSKGTSGIAHDFEGMLRFVDSSNVRLGYSQVTSGGTFGLISDQDNQGIQFNTVVSAVAGARFYINRLGVNSIEPGADNAHTNGSAALRWSTVYAGTGTINTSDEREKQQIGVIPDEWLDAWADVQWQRYKWNEAVERKGSSARWHVGLIAQHVRDAFSARRLDAFEIGLLCYDEWEAVEAVISEEDGTVITPAIEAGNRFGVRHDQAQALEAAWQRREIGRLRQALTSLAA
ncbi:tail fiber domain-containing protein [Mesorhizobium sp. 128a]